MKEEAAEAVVVGGGVIGCSVALALAARHVDVTLIERGDIASGTSGISGGHLGLFDKGLGLKLKLAKRTLQWLDDLSEDDKERIGYKRVGGTMLATREEDVEQLDVMIDERRAAGLECRLLETDTLVSWDPSLNENAFFAAAFIPGDGRLWPKKFTELLADKARTAGASII